MSTELVEPYDPALHRADMDELWRGEIDDAFAAGLIYGGLFALAVVVVIGAVAIVSFR